MRFAVLGPLRLEVAGDVVAAGPAKQRMLLTLLLLRANEVVPLSAITEELWDDAPPRSSSANLRTYLAGIRRLLPDTERARMVVRPHGHLLRVAADEWDAGRFAVLARQGQAALASGGYREAADRLRAALGLWRGEVAEDVPAGAVSARHRASFHDQRLVAWENLIEARLALGDTGGLRSELRELIAADPVRERGWALLMTALYRAGDQAGALRAFADARTALVQTLGIEPGPELRRLQRLVLAGEELPGTSSSVRTTGGRATGTRWNPVWQLPPDPGGFTGRSDELDSVTAFAEGPPGGVLAITGMAGVGKTTLTVHWAHQNRDRSPDGQIYLDLRGHGRPLTPGEALDVLLRSVGVPAERIPGDTDGRAALWRSALHGRRVLVVFDAVHDDQQVRHLLPAAGWTVLTSRSQLRGLVVHEGVRRLILDRMPSPDAEGDVTAALTRLLDWYLHTATRADECLGRERAPSMPPVSAPGVAVRAFRNHEEAIGWFHREHGTLLAAVELAAREGLDHQCWQLACVLWRFLRFTQPADNWIELYQLALEAAQRTGSRRAQAETASILATIHTDRGEYAEAIGHFQRALELYQEVGAVRDQARTLDNLGVACCRAGRLTDALLHQLRALRIDEGTSAPTEVLTLGFTHIAITYARLNRHAEAVSCAERAVAMSRPGGDHVQLALALQSLGEAYRSRSGDMARAVPCYREAAAVNHRIGNIRGEAVNWADLAEALCAIGDERGAVDAWRQASALFERLREPRAEAVRRLAAGLVTQVRPGARPGGRTPATRGAADVRPFRWLA